MSETSATQAAPAHEPTAASAPAGLGNIGAFLLMAVIWGGTWVAVKAGVMTLPPMFFAGLRYALVGAILAALVRGVATIPDRRLWGRIVVTGLLMNAATHALIFWGMQFVASGISGLINLSLIPVGLFALAILFGEERARWRHAAALVLGTAGLVILFWDKASLSGNAAELKGAAAIVIGTFCYCFGTVLARPLLTSFAPMQLTGIHAIVGAAGLLATSAIVEPLSGATLRALAAPAMLAGLAYLVLLGTMVAYTIYLRLVRDWGSSQAGLYAFISPVVALVLGWLVFAETIGWREIVGALAMLAAAALAMSGRGAFGGR